MEVTETFSEFFFGCVRECTNQCKEYLSCFGLRFECCTPNDNHLHVEVTHLEWNTLKYRDISTEAITGHGQDGISQLLECFLALTIVCHVFFPHILPPQVLLCISITEKHHTPSGTLSPLPEVCCINDEMDRSWCMYLLWYANSLKILLECFSVVSGTLGQFPYCLFMKDVCKPEVFMTSSSSLVAESLPACDATICLDTI